VGVVKVRQVSEKVSGGAREVSDDDWYNWEVLAGNDKRATREVPAEAVHVKEPDLYFTMHVEDMVMGVIWHGMEILIMGSQKSLYIVECLLNSQPFGE
jgi:hypothetical protein